tara:strand:- start:498 stop:698 length:201 start_codon:yes stop_codon:yes gene_type:complete
MKMKDFDTKESRLIEQIAAREKRALREANRIFKIPTMRRWWVEPLAAAMIVIGFGLVCYFIMKWST